MSRWLLSPRSRDGGAGRWGVGGRWAQELGHRHLFSHLGPRCLLTLGIQQHCAVTQAGATCLLSAAVGSCALAVGDATARGRTVSNRVQHKRVSGCRCCTLSVLLCFKMHFWAYLGGSRQISSVHFKIVSLNLIQLAEHD